MYKLSHQLQQNLVSPGDEGPLKDSDLQKTDV